MGETSAKPIYCHRCGADITGVGFAYHIDRKIRCLECTTPTNKEGKDGRTG